MALTAAKVLEALVQLGPGPHTLTAITTAVCGSPQRSKVATVRVRLVALERQGTVVACRPQGCQRVAGWRVVSGLPRAGWIPVLVDGVHGMLVACEVVLSTGEHVRVTPTAVQLLGLPPSDPQCIMVEHNPQGPHAQEAPPKPMGDSG